MNGYGYMHTALSGNEILVLARRLCGGPIYVYRQTVDAATLSLWEPDDEFALPPEGRAFGPQAEVRWYQTETSGCYQTLILSETRQDLGGTWAVLGTFGVRDTLDTGKPMSIYLLGVWQPKEKAWIEVRIPHTLNYPLDPTEKMARPRALAAEYSQAGITAYIRLLGLESELL